MAMIIQQNNSKNTLRSQELLEIRKTELKKRKTMNFQKSVRMFFVLMDSGQDAI